MSAAATALRDLSAAATALRDQRPSRRRPTSPMPTSLSPTPRRDDLPAALPDDMKIGDFEVRIRAALELNKQKPSTESSLLAVEYCSTKREELARGLKWLWDTKKYVDMTILVGPDTDTAVEFKAHAVVMAACSEPFKAMLTGVYKEASNRTVHIPNHSVEIVAKMLEFIYTGEVHISDEDVIALFTAADQYGIAELKGICEEHVSSGISLKSVIPLMISARNHTAEKLMRKCYLFFRENPVQLFEQSAFKEIPEDLLLEILKLDFTIPEIKVLEAVISWGKHQISISSSKSTLESSPRAMDSDEKDEKDLALEAASSAPTLQYVLRNVIRHVRFISIKKEYLQTVVLPMKVLPEDMLYDILLHRMSEPAHLVGDEEKGSESKEDLSELYSAKPWLKPRGRVYKVFSDFPNEEAYSEYMKQVLRPGMLLKAIRSYENIQKGDTGEFIQYNAGFPPCQVRWRQYGSTYWLYWRDLEIIEQS